MPRSRIEEPDLDPKEKVRRLVEWLGPLENTIQVSWLMEMCREFFDFHDDRITADNWEALYDRAAAKMAAPDWETQVLDKSRLEQVFLTNDFDDPLTGFDTSRYVPCLRTDDLVFHLAKPAVRQRLAKATGHRGRDRVAACRGDRQAVRPLHRARAPAPARFRSRPISSRRPSSGTRSTRS